MTPEQYERIERLFEQAVALPAADRAAFLDEHCADDDEVRRKLEAMLARDAQTTANLDRPVREGGLDLTKVVAGVTGAAGAMSERIGDYRIKSVIASGGMGTVYLAQQEHPRRVVALKIMKQGVASRSALRRFEYESQILARLRHPNIAQVYEAGTHDDGAGGVPYFAMEYVAGAKTLVDYAEQMKLGTRERLALFAKVCDAVHHGHTKGIIHRDLKPGNILVDSTGEPRIIDFGVARATDSDLAVTTLQTDVGQLIGTLQYMSPEQCDADPHDIDTRSDVYALGVVLYQLLSGSLPYDVSQHAVYDAARVVREEAPAKPSTLDRTLRGDVETIALKALEKDRNRRYASAEAFGSDILRYLANEPIQARPPSLRYQLSTFARRRRPLVIGAAAVLVALVGGLALTLVQYRRAEVAAEIARMHFEDARAFAEFFLNEHHDELAPIAGTLAARRALVERASDYLQSLETSLGSAGESSVSVIQHLGLGHRRLGQILGGSRGPNLGEYERAMSHFAEALRLHEQLLSERPDSVPDSLGVISSRLGLGDCLTRLNRGDEAAEQYLAAYDMVTRHDLDTVDDDLVRSRVATVYLEIGDLRSDEEAFEEARTLYVRSLAVRETLSKSDPGNAARTRAVGVGYSRLGDLALAESNAAMARGDDPGDAVARALGHFETALQIRRDLAEDAPMGRFHRDLMYAHLNMGKTLDRQRQSIDMLRHWREAISLAVDLFLIEPSDVRARDADLRRIVDAYLLRIHRLPHPPGFPQQVSDAVEAVVTSADAGPESRVRQRVDDLRRLLDTYPPSDTESDSA